MDGREFLNVAREMAAESTVAHWRSGVGRAYYALFLESRDQLERWGFIPNRRDPIHSFVRLRFLYSADPDLMIIGRRLDHLSQLRNTADYILKTTSFVDDTEALLAVSNVTDALARLDGVDADPPRRAAAIADMRQRWP